MEAAVDVNSAELARAMTALVRAFGLHRPEQTPCGEPIGVAEAHTLIDLSEIKALSQGELAQRLRLEKSTISRLVRQLMVRGWVERTPLPEDGRVMMVRLSEEGRKAADVCFRLDEPNSRVFWPRFRKQTAPPLLRRSRL